MTNPKKSQTLHVENVDEELSVYDWQRQQMHSLNPTAAQVFELCDGETSPEKMAAKLDAPKELIWQSLGELDKAKLLEVDAEKPAWHEQSISRRQFLKVGSAVAAAAIVSIMLPSPAAAQSPGPAPVTQIVLYAAGVTRDGNLGGRAGADAICAASGNRPAGAEYTNFRAFISVSAADEIRDMPGNYGVPTTVPIVGGDGTTQLAPNWAGLLDGNIDATLLAAGNGASDWFSGSNADGSLAATHCTGFTDNTGGATGQAGLPNTTGSNWIDFAGGNCGTVGWEVMCIAY